MKTTLVEDHGVILIEESKDRSPGLHTPLLPRVSGLSLNERLVRKFWANIKIQPDGCWVWRGVLGKGGYSQIYSGLFTHRWAYQYFVGPIPAGLTIDHLCHNRACANPRHLEPVPTRINVLRGSGPSAVNAVKTHCIHGHALVGNNVWVYHPRHRMRAVRMCRVCRQKTWREWDKRRRGVA